MYVYNPNTRERGADRENGYEIIPSGHDTAIAITTQQEIGLPAQGLTRLGLSIRDQGGLNGPYIF